MTAIAKIQINSKYEQLWKAKTRYVLVTGGRGSAKSFAVGTWACYNLTNKDNWKILYTRYTLTTAHISIIPEFMEKIGLLNMEHAVNATQTLIECPARNSGIIFSGIKTSSGNQTAKLKSIPGLNAFIVDEAEEFVNEQDFITIDDSIRMPNVQNIIVIVMNPQDIEHWIWQRWFEKSHRMIDIDGHQIPISTHPDITHIHTTYLDNLKHLNPDYIAKIEKLRETSPEAYAHRYLGKWQERKEGAIYENWVEGEFDESMPYAYGLDLGFSPDPLALVKVAVDSTRMKIYVKEEIYKTKLSDEAALAIILDRVEHKEDMIVNDTSEPRLIDLFLRNGLNMQNAEKGKDSVKEGIRQLSKFQIVVTSDSYNVKSELRCYIWNDKKASVPVDADNHAMDAMRYAAIRLLQGSDFISGNY